MEAAAVEEAQVPVMPDYGDPSLRRKYVVLGTGVGMNWVHGDVVTGRNFFSDERQRVQRTRRILNRANGKFEFETIEERYANEAECIASLNSLLALGAIRPATQVEAQLSKVELEKPNDIHALSSNEQKIAAQDEQIAELKRQVAALQDKNVVARAITETREAQENYQPPAPMQPQAPPGGRPGPARATKAMAAVE